VRIQRFKRILSFGGWSFSTDTDTYPIFRQSVTATNRETFANNVVQFVKMVRAKLPAGKTLAIAVPAS